MKKIIAALVSILFVFSCVVTTYAKEEKENRTLQATEANATDILLNYGYEKNQFKFLQNEQRLIIAKALLINPELVKRKKIITRIDELSLLEKVVNLSDEKLLELGMTKKDILETREQIEKIASMDNKQIMDEYNKSEAEAKLIKEAITPQKEYFLKSKKGIMATASGSAGNADIEVANWVVDLSGQECGAVAYYVTSTFEWLEGFVWRLDDQFLTCWGGGLNSKNITGTAYYTNGYPVENFETTTRELKVLHQDPNLTVNFKVPCLSDEGNALYAGTTGMVIFQNEKNNFSTKVLSEYAHKYLAVAGAGFSVSTSGDLGFSVSLSLGYSSSGQAEEIILT